jgi:hypothetical protein
MTSSKDLDKYYTKAPVAQQCYEWMKPFVSDNTLYIEPSAGAGAFLSVVKPEAEIIGFDLVPEGSGIIQCDYTLTDVRSYLTPEQNAKNIVCIGNPPFGKKAKLAINFVNKSLNDFGLVGFILPIQFRKWSAQKHIIPDGRLILDNTLPEDSFELDGKTYKVRCSFQLWSLAHPEYADLRMRGKPETTHPDFDMWQFNRTLEAEKFFDYDWDFAVPRQGYQDYTFKATDKSQCDRKKQWIFFKAKTEEALENLRNLDFVALSLKNTGIPGFGKADVVEMYQSKYE